MLLARREMFCYERSVAKFGFKLRTWHICFWAGFVGVFCWVIINSERETGMVIE